MNDNPEIEVTSLEEIISSARENTTMTTYRGFEITQKPNGKFEWVDDRNFVHTGMIDATGGYETEEAAMSDIDAYKRRMREAKTG